MEGEGGRWKGGRCIEREGGGGRGRRERKRERGPALAN